ncbi:MAG: MBG domain-containing protein [Blautia wexlerae]
MKPDDLHKHIGGEEPQLTYTTDGIVEGETLSGITLQRVSGEDARKYDNYSHRNSRCKSELYCHTRDRHLYN